MIMLEEREMAHQIQVLKFVYSVMLERPIAAYSMFSDPSRTLLYPHSVPQGKKTDHAYLQFLNTRH